MKRTGGVTGTGRGDLQKDKEGEGSSGQSEQRNISQVLLNREGEALTNTIPIAEGQNGTSIRSREVGNQKDN